MPDKQHAVKLINKFDARGLSGRQQGAEGC